MIKKMILLMMLCSFDVGHIEINSNIVGFVKPVNY